jgi:hypothetical protein
VQIGDLEVIPVNDGVGKLSSSYIPKLDWDVHKDLLDDEGNFEINLACFLIRQTHGSASASATSTNSSEERSRTTSQSP